MCVPIMKREQDGRKKEGGRKEGREECHIESLMFTCILVNQASDYTFRQIYLQAHTHTHTHTLNTHTHMHTHTHTFIYPLCTVILTLILL